MWSEWLQLEQNLGDCKNIQKVEEKRAELFEDIGQLEERQTHFLVDKYKFMNIYPCNSFELKALGYKDSNNNTTIYVPLMPSGYSQGSTFATNLALTNASIATGSKDLSYNGGEDYASHQHLITDKNSANPFRKLASKNLTRFAMPDTSKMLPFKSNKNAFNGLCPVPGGGPFLFPAIFADMIKRLPSPINFDVLKIIILLFLNIKKS